MITSGVYIDDSGMPGVQTKSKFLHESRKSWCGVVAPSKISADLTQAMSIFIDGVKSDYGASELHFTDIFNGRGTWKSVKVDQRIMIFDLMGLIFEKFQMPVFYQTWSVEYEDDHKEIFENLKQSNFKFWKPERIDHMGLIILIIRLGQNMWDLRKLSSDFDEIFPILIDEGLAKAGNKFKTPCEYNGVFTKEVSFVSSNENLGIQMADFAAFVISRTQWIIHNKTAGESFSRADKHILSICNKFNHWSLELIVGEEKSLSKSGLEFLLMRDRQNKKLNPIPNSDV